MENLNLTQLLNSPYSSRILAAIFGLIKHFPDFKNTQEKIGDEILQIWTKI